MLPHTAALKDRFVHLNISVGKQLQEDHAAQRSPESQRQFFYAVIEQIRMNRSLSFFADSYGSSERSPCADRSGII